MQLLTRLFWIAICLLTMAALDFITGQELVFSCAYLLPVSLAAWWFGRPAALAMAAVSGLTSLLVDSFDGYEYTHPLIGVCNALTCAFIAAVIGLVISQLKRMLTEREAASRQLHEALKKVDASAKEITRLQEGLQTVCASTSRIKIGDRWVSPDEFLRTYPRIQVSHGISPEALEEMARSLSDEVNDRAA